MPGTKQKNVHVGVVPPGSSQHISMVTGDYEYWHYFCDGTDDRGWGCGYRTLQTVCSWVRLQQLQSMHTFTSYEAGSTSSQNTNNVQNSDNSNIAKCVWNGSVDDTHNVITVIGSGDISTHGDVISDDVNSSPTASISKCETSISVVACGSAADCFADKTATEKSIGSGEGCDGIVALSSDNTSTLLKTEAPDSAKRMGQRNISDKKCKHSNINVVSRVNQSRGQGPELPVTVEAVENGPSPAAARTVPRDVPSLMEIQKALFQMGDKPEHFVGSRQWIGSYEICLCLDFFYDVPCKIIHISRGAELKQLLSTLHAHFSTLGSPVMMGGDSDTSSKGIVGVCMEPEALLVVDPHYSGTVTSAVSLQTAGWIKWVLLEDFNPTSFYNICLPQLPAKAS